MYDLNAAGFGEEAKEAICAAKHTFDLPGGMSGRGERDNLLSLRENRVLCRRQ